MPFPALLAPSDVPLWADVSRACAANVDAPRPDHKPPRRRKPLLPPCLFTPVLETRCD